MKRERRTEAAHARDVALEATRHRVLVDEEAVTVRLSGDKLANLEIRSESAKSSNTADRGSSRRAAGARVEILSRRAGPRELWGQPRVSSL